MKIFHLNTSDLSGGAAKAAFRLHKGLQKEDISSRMMVQFKESDDNFVIGPVSNPSKAVANLRVTIDHLPLLFYRKRKEQIFHSQWLPDFLIRKINDYRPDVVHLHWVCRGFLNINTLARIQKPIIWTLHDMWPFTGGCHYASACKRYQKSCGSCPQLGSKMEYDLSWWTWKRKAKAWRNLNLSLVAPSRWMKTCIQKSSLFQDKEIEIIPNGIDLKIFRPHDRRSLRSHLGFPLDKKLVLFSAINAISDKRKGFQLLLPAIRLFSDTKIGADAEIIILGATKPKQPPGFGLKSTYMGRLHDDIFISLIYAACDVFVAPSKEDNLPNTIMEAMGCGTPCVSFAVGGIPEMVTHKINGYLAQPFSVEELAKGIEWAVKDNDRHNELSIKARHKAETGFDLRRVANQYTKLYEKIIQNRS